MPLQDITNDLKSEFGFSTAVATRWVNMAAKEVHKTRALHFAKMEQLLEVPLNQQLVALPWFVDHLIHARVPDSRRTVEQQAFEPKYQRYAWVPPFLAHRIKGRSPLYRDIDNAAYLTFTLPEAEPSAFSITVQGSTLNAARVTEVVVFNVGDVTKNTVNSFESVKVIAKSATTAMDITVTDVAGNVMSVIPNHLLSVDYQIMQMQEIGIQYSQTQIYDVLYKIKLEPLVNGTDQFLGVEVYDPALFWYAKGLAYQKTADRAGQDAALAMQRGITLFNSIDAAYENTTDQVLTFKANPISNLFRFPEYYGFSSRRIR